MRERAKVRVKKKLLSININTSSIHRTKYAKEIVKAIFKVNWIQFTDNNFALIFIIYDHDLFLVHCIWLSRRKCFQHRMNSSSALNVENEEENSRTPFWATPFFFFLKITCPRCTPQKLFRKMWNKLWQWFSNWQAKIRCF